MVSFTALNNSQHFINLKKEENAIEANGLKVYLKINNLETSRLGINISSKGTNAVNRNKFKRRIKEAVRGLKIEINVDIYVIGSNQSSDISLKDIKEILISHPKLKTKMKISTILYTSIRSILNFFGFGQGNCLYVPTCSEVVIESIEKKD